MNATTVAVDLAKSVFQVAGADANWMPIESHRLTRAQFERWFANREVGLVIMEACGSAHHWARWLNRRTAPERCCVRLNWRAVPVRPWMDCEPGPRQFRRVRITTRRRVPWPTSWPGSVMPCSGITSPMAILNPDQKRS